MVPTRRFVVVISPLSFNSSRLTVVEDFHKYRFQAQQRRRAERELLYRSRREPRPFQHGTRTKRSPLKERIWMEGRGGERDVSGGATRR